MKYTNAFSKCFFGCLSIGLLAACKKFVEIGPPNTRIVTASVFNNSSATTSALLGIYTQMTQDSYSMSLYGGILSDELTNYSAEPGIISLYSNSMSSITTPGPWNNAYNYIYQANAIMEGLGKYGGGNAAIAQQLMGEAKFIRAYWYFYLTNCYGDVPLATTTDYTVNSQLARTARSDVYKQIISDLKDAETLLNSNFVDQSDTATTADRVRPTTWAAAALLARTYLYMGDYINAGEKATEVINDSTMFAIQPDLSQVFLANSSEAIWQLAVPTPGFISSSNTLDGYAFILNMIPRNSGNTNISTISNQLIGAFEPGDQRKISWIGKFIVSAPADTFNFPFKYKVYQSGNITEYTMMLRLAEQYLIRAEAGVQTNADPASILKDINTVRHRAGLPDYAGGMDKQSLLSAILHERQVEFFAEWGHRWFDLIRTNEVDDVMKMVSPLKGGTWSSTGKLFPIPQSERWKDTHLTQNDGYN